MIRSPSLFHVLLTNCSQYPTYANELQEVEMNFWTLKDETTFREYLSLAGYGVKQNQHGRFEVLEHHGMVKMFAQDMGVSSRTVYRWYQHNNAPGYIMKVLKIMSGYLDEIHPLWKDYGINRATGELFSKEDPTLNFTPALLKSASWFRSRASDYESLKLRLENDRAQFEESKKEQFGNYIKEIENATQKAASDAIRALLDLSPPSPDMDKLRDDLAVYREDKLTHKRR